jgi:mono/diheme cytochrome c family protein
MRDIHGRGGFALLAAASVYLATVELSGAPVPTLLMKAQAAVAQPAPAAAADASRETLKRYCATCHNSAANTAATQSGVVLDKVDLSAVGEHPELWERVLRRLHAGTMPPQGARHPSVADVHALTAYLESALDREASLHPNPGRPLLHRLNRAEYANAIRDLLALDVDIASLLPADDSAYGFDNVADALGVSPALQERYLSAAETISALAVGDVHQPTVTDTHQVRQDLSQNQHIEGLPLGTLGGTRIQRWFPLDADYDIKVGLFRTNFGNLRGLEHPHQVELAVDGARMRLVTIGGDEDLKAAFEKPTETADAVDARLAMRLPLTAGPHTITVTFVENAPLVGTVRLEPFIRSSYDTLDWTGRPHIDHVTITGPFNVRGHGETRSRSRIFACHPSGAIGGDAADNACAHRILASLVRRAYREPSATADLAPVFGFYEQVRHREKSFDAGIEAALQLVLASPKFLFRAEADPPGAAAGRVYRINDVELASRLSFFLWSSIPDDTLLDLAGSGRLHEPAAFEAQLRRMLHDPKSHALVSNFAGQWLQLRNQKTLQPNSDEFPDFDDNLRQAFQHETELFFESIVSEDRDVLDLMTARDTFVNDRLAKHYGIPGVYGSQFRRVTLTDESRFGLLGKGAILAVTSHAARTSPVVRGKWILENILGAPVPPPPPLPGAGVFAEPAPGEAPKTMRAQMEAHRTNPVCASCHRLMDPIGISLENFDAVGAWRTREANGPIDASGELSDGTEITGVNTLRQALMRRPDVFVETMTEKLMTYALGRGLDEHDMPAVRRIVRDVGHDDHRFSSLVLGIATSVPFQMRATGDPPAAGK